MAVPVTSTMPEPFPPQLTQDNIREKPWRYIGYKGFSEWLASDEDFFIVRRFDTLASRVILTLQWELTKLEAKLTELDLERSHQIIEDRHNGSIELDDDVRREHIRDCHTALLGYCRY